MKSSTLLILAATTVISAACGGGVRWSYAGGLAGDGGAPTADTGSPVPAPMSVGADGGAPPNNPDSADGGSDDGGSDEGALVDGT